MGVDILMIDCDDLKLTIALDTLKHHRIQVALSGVTVLLSGELICADQAAGVNP